ncbi:hypothetical protein HNO88_003865 [Novosphingobium chloroacetimidivorans]|uniref:Uncharacterized protein n=1 Tax=Novosphingobium chloroacetimidivorans TaxID=1428314 RepID=A0A7W7KDP9_9SPHN|nr:hypothetical protein [Novosphingobium chloroacetimidivorans]MBB4860521.1 hypothetical protein [Novosphingobium chloroacetimidivorans]
MALRTPVLVVDTVAFVVPLKQTAFDKLGNGAAQICLACCAYARPHLIINCCWSARPSGRWVFRQSQLLTNSDGHRAPL